MENNFGLIIIANKSKNKITFRNDKNQNNPIIERINLKNKIIKQE